MRPSSRRYGPGGSQGTGRGLDAERSQFHPQEAGGLLAPCFKLIGLKLQLGGAAGKVFIAGDGQDAAQVGGLLALAANALLLVVGADPAMFAFRARAIGAECGRGHGVLRSRYSAHSAASARLSKYQREPSAQSTGLDQRPLIRCVRVRAVAGVVEYAVGGLYQVAERDKGGLDGCKVHLAPLANMASGQPRFTSILTVKGQVPTLFCIL